MPTSRPLSGPAGESPRVRGGSQLHARESAEYSLLNHNYISLSMAPLLVASATSYALRPLLGVIEKSAIDGEQCCFGVMPGQQGSAARRPSGLRAACPGKAGSDDLSKTEKESGVTHRSSAPGVLAPEVSLPAALVKARALKAQADLMPSEWCGLTSYARPSNGGRESPSFPTQHFTKTYNNKYNHTATWPTTKPLDLSSQMYL